MTGWGGSCQSMMSGGAGTRRSIGGNFLDDWCLLHPETACEATTLTLPGVKCATPTAHGFQGGMVRSTVLGKCLGNARGSEQGCPGSAHCPWVADSRPELPHRRIHAAPTLLVKLVAAGARMQPHLPCFRKNTVQAPAGEMAARRAVTRPTTLHSCYTVKPFQQVWSPCGNSLPQQLDSWTAAPARASRGRLPGEYFRETAAPNTLVLRSCVPNSPPECQVPAAK